MAGPALPPVTKALLILNVLFFLADFLTRPGPINPYFGKVNALLCFTVESALMEGRVWKLLTFQFLHATFGHIIFNSFGLYFFGPWIERWRGSARFTAFYLLCGVAGALFYTLLTVTGILPERGPWSGIETPLVGASAGIYGLIIGVAVTQPKAVIHLLLPPVSMTNLLFPALRSVPMALSGASRRKQIPSSVSPFGPTFGCSISKAPPFPWLMLF